MTSRFDSKLIKSKMSSISEKKKLLLTRHSSFTWLRKCRWNRQDNNKSRILDGKSRSRCQFRSDRHEHGGRILEKNHDNLHYHLIKFILYTNIYTQINNNFRYLTNAYRVLYWQSLLTTVDLRSKNFPYARTYPTMTS